MGEPDDELDEIDQRLGDLWSMSYKEQRGCARLILLLILLAIVLLAIAEGWIRL